MKLCELETALAVLGELDHGNLPIHHSRILVWLAQRESATYREIEEHCNLSNAAVSRTLNSLSEESPHRKRTLGLVEIYRDSSCGRRYRVRLNAKGRAFADSLSRLLGEGQPSLF